MEKKKIIAIIYPVLIILLFFSRMAYRNTQKKYDRNKMPNVQMEKEIWEKTDQNAKEAESRLKDMVDRTSPNATVTDNTYTNSYFNLTYTAPEGFTIETDDSDYDMTAYGGTTSIAVFYDETSREMSVEEAVDAYKKAIEASLEASAGNDPDSYKISENETYTIGKDKYVGFSYQVGSDGTIYSHVKELMRIKDKKIIGITINATNDKDIEEALKCFSTK
jgi:hypothetical protein